MKRVTVLGATGSVGTSTLDIVARNPDRYEVEALSANRDAAKLAEAAIRHGAKLAVVGDPDCYAALKDALGSSGIEAAAGEAALVEAAERPADLVMAAIVGCAGLAPVMAAVASGTDIGLANKEALVSAGLLLTGAARQSGARLLPVDSEHNAIFQCLVGADLDHVRRIILTASGGPFRCWSRSEMAAITPEQAVRHPNWSMGAKISVDSATMMNKGLELIEAYHLFPVGAERLDILVHPQSVIHSMVDYVDGSVLAQLGTPDMRTPIAYALAWPERIATPCAPLDLAALARLDFEAPDPARFPALALAREVVAVNPALSIVLNAANEVAVEAFLARRIAFLSIADIVRATLDRYQPAAPASLDEVLAIDAESRMTADRMMKDLAA